MRIPFGPSRVDASMKEACIVNASMKEASRVDASRVDEKGYSQIEDYIRESSMYVFSIVTQAFPTHVR